MALPGELADREYQKFGKDNDAAPTNPIGIFTMGKYTSSDPSLDDGDAAVLTFNSSGQLRVEAATTVSLSIGAEYVTNSAFSSPATASLSAVVRRDTATSTAGADGNIGVLSHNATGHLWTEEKNSSAISGKLPATTTATGNFKVSIEEGSSAGTQYTEGDTDTTITGTAAMWEDTGNTLRAISAAKPLPIDITNSTLAVTQSGQWDITDISGTISLPTGAATAAKQLADGHNVVATGTLLTAIKDSTAAIESGQLADGHNVTVDNASIAVTGTFFQATQPVSAAALPLPSGASTAANQSTANTSLSNIEGQLPATTTTTGNFKVSIEEGSSSGTEYTLGTDTYLEGTTAGPMAAAVRNDTLATLADTDNEIAPLQVNDVGALYVELAEITGTAVDTDAGNSSAGTQRVVLASDQPVISIDDNSSSLTVDNAGAFAIQEDGAALTAVQRTALAVATESSPLGSGVLMQGDDGTDRTNVLVDTSGHLQVDVLTGGGGGTQYILGTATYSEATTVSTMAGAVRNDTLAALADTDNELAPLQVNASGALYTVLSAGTAEIGNVKNSGTFAVQSTLQTGTATVGTVTIQDGGQSVTVDTTGTSGLEVIQDTAADLNVTEASAAAILIDTGNIDGKLPATTTTLGNLKVSIEEGSASGTEYTEDEVTANPQVGGAIMMERDNQLAAVTPAEGDWIGLRGSSKGALWVTIPDASGDPITSFGGGTQYTFGTDTYAETTNIGTMAGAVRNDTLATLVNTDNEIAPLQVNGSGALYTVLSAGTATVGTVTAQGAIAHDLVDAGNPIKVGHKAIDIGANPTEVAADDRTDWYANRAGVPWVIGGHPNIQTISNNYTGVQADTALVTVGAGEAVVVTKASVYLGNDVTVDVNAVLGFGTSTITSAGQFARHPAIAAGSGFVEGTGAGIVAQGAGNEDLRFTCATPTTGALQVNVSYYTIAI